MCSELRVRAVEFVLSLIYSDRIGQDYLEVFEQNEEGTE